MEERILLFFSSRRRHTRWPRDWSSDVCSSDLGCVLNCEQDCGTPLTTSGNTLNDAQQDEQQWCKVAQRVIGGQQADEGGCPTHGKEGDHQDEAAAQAVAIVPG